MEKFAIQQTPENILGHRGVEGEPEKDESGRNERMERAEFTVKKMFQGNMETEGVTKRIVESPYIEPATER